MDDSSGQGRLERWLARALPYAPVAIATFWLARATSRGILARAGEPAVPLDDAYIHFQYARSLAEGRFYAFLPGDGYTSGATSLLWPALLAPFYAVGFRDTAIVWAAWLLGWVFLGLLAIETRRLAMGLLDDLSATGAAAAVIAFGGYTWFAASGMEVSLLAWLLALAARLSAEWAEKREARTSRDLAWMVGVAVVAPLSRPEGMVASLLIALTLAVFPGERVRRAPSRVFALAALLGPLVPPLINKAFTGHFSTTTTQVKWLVGNPYYGGPHLWAMVRANLDTFFRVLLDGREWSAIFVPPGSFPVAIAAVIAVPVVGFRTRRSWRTLMVLALIAGMLLPTTYLSFLWNRLRYLWPFAFAWCIGLACLGRAVADVLSLIRPRFVRVAPILVGIGAGMLGHHLSWSMDDVANSAYAIHNQQVKLGRWAQANLPAGVRIGVNDTGAIAYFSGHRVFDVVGLTTPGEAPYWVAGAGSRFEHYERLHRATPSVLPTHFIVYPHWMACEPVLGRELTRATVTDQSILGGTTMIAYEARWDLLHTGDKPMDPPRGLLLDELDVSDLESEREHAYDLAAGGGTDNENRVRVRELEDRTLVDGGREHRVRDPFVLSFPTGKPAILVARWSSEHGARLDVRVAGAVVDTVAIPPTSWIERRVALPVGASGKVDVEVATRDGLFGSMHYWLYDASAP